MTQPSTNDEIDFVKIALRHKALLLAGVLAGTAAGHLLYQHLGPEYLATGKILVSKKAGVQLREGESSDVGGRAEHVALIMSPLIVEKAVEIGRLKELPSMAKVKDVAEEIVTSLKVQRSAGQDSSVMNVVDITYKNRNRDDAIRVVDSIIEAYDQFLGEIHRKRISELTKHIDGANGSLRQQIVQQETVYEKFRAEAPIHLKQTSRSGGGERAAAATNIHQENLEVLDKERQQLLLRKSELMSQIQSIESALSAGYSREDLAASIQLFNTTVRAPQEGAAAVANNSALNSLVLPGMAAPRPENASLESQWLALKLQHEQLALTYGPEWPGIETIGRQLALIEWQFRQKGLKLPSEAVTPNPVGTAASPNVPGATVAQAQAPKTDLVGLYLSSLRQQLDVVMRREMEISRVYSVEFDNARQLARYVEKDRRLQEDLDRLNGLWNVVREQAAKVDLLKDHREFTVQSISPIRDTLSMKRMIKLYGAGLGSVLGLTAGFIALFEMRRRNAVPTVQSSDMPVGVPVARPADIQLPFATLGQIPRSQNGPRRSLAVFQRPESPEAESYRAVAESVLAQVGPNSSVVMATSGADGVGCSTVAANVSLALAQSGRRVLLIDADFVRATQHQFFGIPNDVGLTEVLYGEIDLLTAARPTQVPGHSVLPTGALQSAIDLSGVAFRNLLTEARREFDLVLIDAPNIATSHSANEVAQRSNFAIFVWQPDRAVASETLPATSRLQHGMCSVLGAVATGCTTGSVRTVKPFNASAPLDPRQLPALV